MLTNLIVDTRGITTKAVITNLIIGGILIAMLWHQFGQLWHATDSVPRTCIVDEDGEKRVVDCATTAQ